jgi:hypothetical protein
MEACRVLLGPTQVEVVVHAACHRIAEETATLKEQTQYLCMANLTFLGPAHSAAVHDLARAIADFLAAWPQQAAAMVILPNTAQNGMGSNHSEDFVRQARRHTMEKFEDAMWKLETRECTFHFDETQMYSPQRALTHSLLFLLSEGADKNESPWRRSVVWNRKCISGLMPVLQRPEFVNPLDETEGKTSISKKLSEAAELKQHVTGVPFYKEVPEQ